MTTSKLLENVDGTAYIDGPIEYYLRKKNIKPRFYGFMKLREEVFVKLLENFLNDKNSTECSRFCFLSDHVDEPLLTEEYFYWTEDKDLCTQFKLASSESTVRFCTNNMSTYDEMLDTFYAIRDKNPKKPNDSKFDLICSSNRGLFTRKFNIRETKGNITPFYNDDLLEFDKIIKEKLKTDRNGVVLLHGEPGTGKTSYIRHLINTVGKDVLYLPPDLAVSLSTPEFQTFILDNAQNKILIIEDAETILMSREGGGNQAVANILNISDGILGDALRVQLVCTFNTKISEIDPALRRAGRLLGEHKFTKLTVQKAKNLAKDLFGEAGEQKVQKDMTVAEVFALETEIPRLKENKIGFGFIQLEKDNKSDDDIYAY